MSLCYLSLMLTPKWPSFSPLEATLVNTCGWSVSRYSRGGGCMPVKAGIGWIWCSTDVILSLCCLRFTSVYEPMCGDFTQNLELQHLWICIIKLCYQFAWAVTRCIAEERVHIRVPDESLSALTPSGQRSSHFGFLTAQLEVLSVCLKQQQRTFSLTALVAFTQASHTKYRQKSELTSVNMPQ